MAVTHAPLTGADVLVHALERRGLGRVWGFPDDVPRFVDRLRRSSIDYVPTRLGHTVAVVAQATAPFSAHPTVCAASADAGAVHVMTTVARAHLAGVPVVALVEAPDAARGGCLFAGLIERLRPLVKLDVAVSAAEEIPVAVDRACHAALDGAPGPAIVRLARPALDEPVDADAERRAMRSLVLEARQTADDEQIGSLQATLRTHQAPVVVAAEGVVRERAGDVFRAFAERFQVPVFLTRDAAGVLPADHPLCLGVLAEDAADAGAAFLRAADVVVVVGGDAPRTLPAPLVDALAGVTVVAVGGAVPGGGALRADVRIVAGLRDLLERLVQRDPGVPRVRADVVAFRQRLRESAPAARRAGGLVGVALDVLHRHLRADDVIVSDAALAALVGGIAGAPGRRTLVFPRTPAVGFAVPAALGIKSTDAARRVVALCRDVDLLASIQEIETSVTSDLPIVVVLFTAREATLAAPDGRAAPDAPPFVHDVVGLVESLGAVTIRCRTGADFERACRQACHSPITTLLVAPMQADARDRPAAAERLEEAA
jgi:acetolactate synthase-1/2/3 large subunit